MNNTIDSVYSGSPKRLYVIDREGIIQFCSAEEPFDDKEIEKWEWAIKKFIT